MAAEGPAPPDLPADGVDVERDLGDEDDVGGGGDAGVERDPTRVAPHQLDGEDTLVRRGGRVQAVDGLGGDADRGVETEGERRAGQVVVDRLRHTDDRHPLVPRGVGGAYRAVPARGYQRVDAEAVKVVAHLGRAVDGAPLARRQLHR